MASSLLKCSEFSSKNGVRFMRGIILGRIVLIPSTIAVGPFCVSFFFFAHLIQKLTRELTVYPCSVICSKTFSSEKVQVGKDQEKAQSEKDSHSKNRGGKNQTNNQVLIP